jgi:hypothetical protein
MMNFHRNLTRKRKYEINISLDFLIQIEYISERAYVYKQVNKYYLIFNVEQVV